MMKLPIHKTATAFVAALTIGLFASQVVGADKEADSRKSPKRTVGAVTQTPPQKPTAIRTTSPQPSGNTAVTNTGVVQPSKNESNTTTVTSPTQAVAAPLTGEQIGWLVFSGGGGRVTSASNSMDMTIGQTPSGTISNGSFKINLGFQQEFSPGSCCTGTTGNVNMAGIVDLGDLSALVSFLTGGGYVLPCALEANVNNGGIVDLGDLSALVSFLTGGGYVLPNCP